MSRIWSARDSAATAMGDDETGHVPLGEEATPQLGFGVDVESRGQVVEDEQLGVGGQHPRRCRPLHLASRQLDPSGPDHGLLTHFESFQIGIEHGELHRVTQTLVGHSLPEGDVVRQRFGEEPGYLGGVGGTRRHEERRPVLDWLPVPQHVAVGRDQPEEGADQGALSRPDLSGNHREGAAVHSEIDAFEALATIREPMVEPVHLQPLQRIDADVGEFDLRDLAFEGHPVSVEQLIVGSIDGEGTDSLVGNTGPAVLGNDVADECHVVGEPGQIGEEQRQLPDAESSHR